jgi:glycosyltransferase involved in cell wall biosynthesis
MALYGDISYDSRVLREAATLAADGLEVIVSCLAGEQTADVLPSGVTLQVLRPTVAQVVPGTPSPFTTPRSKRRFAIAARVAWIRGYSANLRAWGRMVRNACGDVDAWHLHDLTGLVAVAPGVHRTVPIVYDAHELFLETGTALHLPGPARAALRAYERHLVARAAAVVTVNDALAAVLRARYRPARIVVVHNCPERWSRSDEEPDSLRDAAGIDAAVPVVLYHGALSAYRGIEQLMGSLLEPGLDDVHLVLLGYGELRDRYVAEATDPRWGGRVHVLDPVAPPRLLSWVASADVGAMPIQPSTLNHRLSTPNKLFECLAAGVPVVASDFPSMRHVVEDDPTGALGVVCDPTRVDAVAAAIRSLLTLEPSAREALRARCFEAVRTRWNWDVQVEGLVRLYRDILDR